MNDKTIIRLFVVLVGVYVLAWVFWERIPELARALPYYEKTFVFVGEGLHKVESVRNFVLNSRLSEYIWQNRATFAGGYALLGLLMLVNPIYRNDRERFIVFCRTGCMVLGGILFLIGVAWLGTAADGILKPLKLVHALLMIALGLVILIGFYGGLYIGLPLALLFLLFLLPGAVYDALRLIVWAPVLVWQWLHYLTVPHPAEAAYLAGIRDHLPRDELAGNVADAIREDAIIAFRRLPPAWKSRNQEKRIDALCRKVKASKEFAQEVKRHCCD